VPLLLQMGEERLALTSAVAHGDAELIYLLLLHLKARLPSALFFELLQPHPAAQRLLIHFCRQQDTKTLREFLYHADQPLEAASLAAAEGYRAETLSQRTRGLALARQFYEVAAARAPLGVAASLSFSPAGDTGASHHAALMAHATGEQLRLLTAQLNLERETAGAPPPPAAAALAPGRWRFVDLPLNETLFRCFVYGQAPYAERLRLELRVPERRWWRIKVRGLAQLRDWPALWLFYNSARRPPLSAAAFAEAAIANGAPAEAARYAPRMPPAEAVPLLLQCGEASAARAIALANKDKNPELLRRVSAHLGAAP